MAGGGGALPWLPQDPWEHETQRTHIGYIGLMPVRPLICELALLIGHAFFLFAIDILNTLGIKKQKLHRFKSFFIKHIMILFLFTFTVTLK